MEFRFSSIEEIQEFMDRLKKPRTKGGKGEEAETNTADVPNPLPPPTNQMQPTSQMQPAFGGGAPAFGGAAPAGGAGQGAVAFPAPGAPQLAPEVAALVQRITTRIDAGIAAGQPAEAAVTWFRGQCGPEAAQATLDQIKQIFLPRMSMQQLTQIVGFIGA